VISLFIIGCFPMATGDTAISADKSGTCPVIHGLGFPYVVTSSCSADSFLDTLLEDQGQVKRNHRTTGQGLFHPLY